SMPPFWLISSIAISAPWRSSWPCRAHGPESGAIIAILTDLAWARAVAMPRPGIASAPSAKPALTLRRVGFRFILSSLLFRGQRHLSGGRVGGGADEGADDDIFQNAHARERAHHLKGAADAAPADLAWPEAGDYRAGEACRAAGGGEKAVDHVEQCRLAGAVR